jgi:hypothetical protein
MEQLASRWAALVQAVNREFEREGRARDVLVHHDLRALRLSARRPLGLGRGQEEWITVDLEADEVMSRPAAELAREFARTYYACT